jgi:beta-lactamase class A
MRQDRQDSPSGITRRTALAASLLLPAAIASQRADAKSAEQSNAIAALQALEKRHGGRLGVAMRDTGSGKRLDHRADERFPICSTFKMLAAAAILSRVDAGQDHLDRHVMYEKSDLVTYSPETEKHAGTGMALGDICKAAITLSDNTAGNLMLASFGGPPGLTAFARRIGDNVTRLDRTETALNEATPGDPRDTTSPASMAEDLRKILLGNILRQESRAQLTRWLLANTTGDKRLRAGLPKGWRVGDKTGNGDHAVANDLAIAWPPGKPPIIIAVYYAESRATPDERDKIIAAVGRIVAAA